MKSFSFTVLLGCILLASATAGLTTYLLFGSSSGDVPRGATTLAAPEPDLDLELLDRVNGLVAENNELRLRINALESRPQPTARAPVQEPMSLDGLVSIEEFGDFQAEMRRALGTRRVNEQPAPFKQEVADALVEIRRKERVDAVRGYQEKRTARLEQDLAKMEDWLELAPHQVDGVRDVLIAQYRRETELTRLWESGERDEILGERKRANGELFRGEMELVLDEEQFETFWTTVVEGRGGKN